MIHCILVRTLIRCFPGEETAGNVCIFAGMFGIKGLQVSEQGCAIPVIQCSFAADTSACYTEVQIPASEYIEVGVADKVGKQGEFLRIHGIFCSVEDIAHADYVVNEHCSVSADVKLRSVLVIRQVFLYAFVCNDLYGIEYFIGIDTHNTVILQQAASY